MLLNFKEIPLITLPHFEGGEKGFEANMFYAVVPRQ